MELSVFDDPRIRPIVDKGGNRVIYRAIVSRGGETRIIWGCVKENDRRSSPNDYAPKRMGTRASDLRRVWLKDRQAIEISATPADGL